MSELFANNHGQYGQECKSKHGGKRPGAGRKPSPEKFILIQTKGPLDLKTWLDEEAERQGIKTSTLVRLILFTYKSQKEQG